MVLFSQRFRRILALWEHVFNQNHSSLPVTPRFTQSSKDVVADLRFRLKIHFLLVACFDLKCVTVASFTFFYHFGSPG